jgi:hypothetical protein
MTSLEGGPVVGESGDLHAEGSTEHGCDGSNQEGDGARESFHVIDAAVDDGSHDDHESADDFVLCVDEGIGALLDDGSDRDWVVVHDQLLVLLTFKRFIRDLAALDGLKLPVVVESPDEPGNA